MRTAVRLAFIIMLGAVGCGDDGGPPPPDPILPADYADTYVEVRPCRRINVDHDSHAIHIVADPVAAAAYLARTDPIPEGSLVVKEEYEVGDSDCEGPIVRWSVMQKLATGSDPSQLDWHWQRLDVDRNVIEDNDVRYDGRQPVSQCAGCHQNCGNPPDGFDGTCADESDI